MATTPARRSIPGWLANIVQDLELDQRRLVTVIDIQGIRPELDIDMARLALMQLTRRGWLRPIGVRGTYEFIPGAAAGPYPSGDPWLVLRAIVARRPGKFHAGAHSAAWLLGYAARAPQPHIVVAESGTSVPRPLRTAYRVLTTSPAPAHGQASGLPVPTPPELFAEVAQLAPRLRLDAAAGWLRRPLHSASLGAIAVVLGDRTVTTRARAGYIADVCGASTHADAIAALGPVRLGLAALGKNSPRDHARALPPRLTSVRSKMDHFLIPHQRPR